MQSELAKKLLIVAVFLTFVMATPVASVASNTIKLGVAGVQSGDLAFYGTPTVKAAKLVVAQFNAKGGINGKKVELLVEDDVCDPEVAIDTATKLVADGVDVVLGHTCNRATKSALPIYKEAGVVVMSPSATNPDLTQSGSYPNFFRTIPSGDAQAKTEVYFAINKIGAKRIAIVHDNGDYGKGLAEFAKKIIENSGKAEVVFFEGFLPGVVDCIAIVKKIKRHGADAVIFGGYYPEASKIVSIMRKEHMKTAFIAGDRVKTDTFVKSTDENAEGVYVSGTTDNRANPLFVAAIDAHKITYNSAPGAFYSEAYSAALALLNAIDEADSTDMADVVKVLQTKNVDTPVGTIHFDAKGDAVGVGFAMFQVKNGKYVEVE